MRVTAELAGGLHLLFSNQKELALELAPGADGRVLLRAVIAELRAAHLKEHAELFAQGEGVRPGILVLLNEVDWELVGALDAELKAGCVRLCKGGAVRNGASDGAAGYPTLRPL
jgi:ubiquitin related modifier 1